MAVTAQSQYLRIYNGETDSQLWQSYYVNETVNWAGKDWDFQPFNVDGIVAGDVSSEGSLTVTIPATSITLPALRTALRFGYLVEVSQYEFDPQLGNNEPQSIQLLIAQYTGEVVSMKGRFTWVEIELGSTLAPIGIQVPPRTMTSQLIGVPVQL
jgi:phage-related protein